jgi:WD40 repeat protein
VDGVESFALIAGTKWLIAGSSSGVDVRDALSFAIVAKLGPGMVTGFFPLAHGQVISTHWQDGHVLWLRWDLNTKQSLATGVARHAPQFAYAPIGDWLAVNTGQFVEVWHGATLIKRMTVPDPQTRPRWSQEVGPFSFGDGIAFSMHEKLLGVVTAQGNATVWEVPSLRRVGTGNHENFETALPEAILFSSGLPARRTGFYTATVNGWSERIHNREWGYSSSSPWDVRSSKQPGGQRDDVLLFDAQGVIAIDPSTGKTRRTYRGAEGNRYGRVWTDPDKRFVLASSPSRISVWDYTTAQSLREIPQEQESIARLFFDPKGSTLGIVSSDFTSAAVRCVESGRNDLHILRISRASGEDINGEATPRGLLVAHATKQALKVTNLVTNEVLLNRPGDFAHGPPLIAPDGASVMAYWFDWTRSKHMVGALSFDDASSVFEVGSAGGDHNSPFSPDAHWAALKISQNNRAHFAVYDWIDKKLIWSDPLGDEYPGIITLGASGMLLTRGTNLVGPDTLIRISNIAERRIVTTFPWDQRNVVNLALDSRAQLVAATTNNGHIIVFDANSGAELQRSSTNTELSLPALALSSRGIVAAGNELGQVYLYSIRKRQLVAQLEVSRLRNSIIVRTPEGRYEVLAKDQVDTIDVVCRLGNRTEPLDRCKHGATPGLLARVLQG